MSTRSPPVPLPDPRSSADAGIRSPWWRELWLDLQALVWPTQCVACGAPDRDCCDPCLGELHRAATVLRAELPVAARATVPLFAGGRYDGPARALVVGLKHEGRVGFARPLGSVLREPLAAARRCATGPDEPVLIAVPSRAERVRERGYRHVELIVSAAERERLRRIPRPRDAFPTRSALPAGPTLSARHTARTLRALRALPGRSGQVGLGRRERELNAARVAVRRQAAALLQGREVIVVDDIVTTGATAAAAVRALAAAGARVIAVVAVCIVERHDAGSVGPRPDPELRDAVDPQGGSGEAPERGRANLPRSGDERTGSDRVRERREGALQGHPPEPPGRSPWM